MQFIIDADTRDSIRGWLTPDNPSATPSLVVIIPGRDEIQMQANVQRDGIRDLGLHATGLVGFDINKRLVSDLDKLDDVEIREAETRLLIYRRFQAGRNIEQKLFLFDCSLMPQRSILSAIGGNFTLNYANSERNSLETNISVITNPFSKSIFISGRSNLNRYSSVLKDKGFVRTALLREPLEELAERLLFLSLLAKSATQLLPVYASDTESLIDFARDLPFNDAKGLNAAFRATTERQRHALTSPMTRIFGCDIGELPERRHVSIALENLATFDVVGTRERYGLFKELLADFLSANVLGDETPISFQSIQTVAAALSRIGLVTDLLDNDLALYSFVDEAISTGIEGGDNAVQADGRTR